VKTHKGYLCLLEGGLLGSSLSQRLDSQAMLITFLVKPCELDEQGEVELPKLFTPTFRPLLVVVLRK
jgi:hypothetical protein